MLSRETAKLQMQTRKSDSCGKAGRSQMLAGVPRVPAAATDLSVLSSTRDMAGGWRGAPHSMWGGQAQGVGWGALIKPTQAPHSGSQQFPGSSYKPSWDKCDLKKKKKLKQRDGRKRKKGS